MPRAAVSFSPQPQASQGLFQATKSVACGDSGGASQLVMILGSQQKEPPTVQTAQQFEGIWKEAGALVVSIISPFG